MFQLDIQDPDFHEGIIIAPEMKLIFEKEFL